MPSPRDLLVRIFRKRFLTSFKKRRTFLESVSALKSHLNGTKHVKNASEPQRQAEELSIENGKCKWKGKKRQAEEENVGRLSKRERTRQNKIARSIPLLPQVRMFVLVAAVGA